MLMPKRTKYRKPHRVSYKGKAKGAKKVDFGEYGLMALEGNWIGEKEIEAARIAINRHMKRSGKIWLRTFPQMTKTKKPAEVRMGSGKGNPDSHVAVVKKGTIIFEVSIGSEEIAREALRLGNHKLSSKCKFVKRKGELNG